MLLIIFIIFLTLWGFGIFTGYTMGCIIHDMKENKAGKVQEKIGQIKNVLEKQL
jgi:hypothetical protein